MTDSNTKVFETADSAIVSSRRLMCLGLVQAAIVGWIAILSRRFEYHLPLLQHPILLIISLFLVCFLFHLISLVTAKEIRNQSTVKWIVLSYSLVFRGLLLFSYPIQEVDIYRYLWDGASISEGVNPYQYSPQQVQAAVERPELPADLRRLVQLREESQALQETLSRVHYGELTTVYPPVSQAVFGLAAFLTPRKSPVQGRIVIFKVVLLTFDLATVFGVMWLLRRTGLHVGWSIAYAWSPLVLKEFANSGHLDAIAVSLCVAAVVGWVILIERQQHVIGLFNPVLTGALLGLATGAKLYPIVLLPLMVIVVCTRNSWKTAAMLTGSCLIVAALSLAPMLTTHPVPTSWESSSSAPDASGIPSTEPQSDDTPADAPQRGLTTFLKQWEINDLPFMLCFENLRPPSEHRGKPANDLWFVVTPASFRTVVTSLFSRLTGHHAGNPAFVLTRLLTMVLFSILALSIGVNAARDFSTQTALNAVFLTLAWFWLLSPTMNPWYWTWVLPFLPFARKRAWFAVSGVLFLYYSRFWLAYHFADTSILGTDYAGEDFFHFVVVPVEHGLWLTWLALESVKCARFYRRDVKRSV